MQAEGENEMTTRDVQRDLFTMGDDREDFKEFLKGVFRLADEYCHGIVRETFEELETEREFEAEMEEEALGDDF